MQGPIDKAGEITTFKMPGPRVTPIVGRHEDRQDVTVWGCSVRFTLRSRGDLLPPAGLEHVVPVLESFLAEATPDTAGQLVSLGFVDNSGISRRSYVPAQGLLAKKLHCRCQRTSSAIETCL